MFSQVIDISKGDSLFPYHLFILAYKSSKEWIKLKQVLGS